MLEPFQVADKIEGCNLALEKLCAQLDGLGDEKVEAEVNYDKEFEIALETLADMDVPVTVREKRAKGILAKNGTTYRLKVAEIKYKAIHTKIKAAESALNGWQSYNKYLDVGVSGQGS